MISLFPARASCVDALEVSARGLFSLSWCYWKKHTVSGKRREPTFLIWDFIDESIWEIITHWTANSEAVGCFKHTHTLLRYHNPHSTSCYWASPVCHTLYPALRAQTPRSRSPCNEPRPQGTSRDRVSSHPLPVQGLSQWGHGIAPATVVGSEVGKWC